MLSCTSQFSCISYLNVITMGARQHAEQKLCFLSIGLWVSFTTAGTGTDSCGISELRKWKPVAIKLVNGSNSAFQTCVPEHTHPFKVGTCPKDWPSRGEITFKDYRMRYRDNTPLVLDGLNLNIQSGQTVGIVGRTGSGEDRLCICFFGVVCLNLLSMCQLSHIRATCMSAGLLFSPKSCYCKLGFQAERVWRVGSKYTVVFGLIK
jgi:hypothetical protein